MRSNVLDYGSDKRIYIPYTHEYKVFLAKGSAFVNITSIYHRFPTEADCIAHPARDADVLKTEQEQRYAKAADTLMRAFATVGIIALVDEATGYQAEREKDELQKILSAYISPELMPWTKRFPPEFYEQMFRLRNWQYRPLSTKRPLTAGKLTNQLVYEKLPPGVLDELRRKNPTDETGRRKHKHHQFLTNDVGNPHLEKHLAVVTTLMRISPNWRVFMSHFSRAFPPEAEQMTFEFEDEEETGKA